ncbi:MAG: hypothetical protein ACR2QK_05795 [Acidimicrobiales bacterium]
MADTYPPPEQILSALGIEVAWTNEGTLLGRATVDPALLGRGEEPPGVGALVPVVDLVAGARAARSVEGDWLATADVWLYERAPMSDRPIELQTRLLRSGKRSTVVAVEVEAGGEPVASSTIEFSRIRREAASLDTRTPDPAGQWTRLGSGPLLEVPLEQACGFRIVDPSTGLVELDRSRFVNNSIGTLQGGAIALLADVSASTMAGPGWRTIDLHFRFLDQTGDGPARATAEIVRVESDSLMINVVIVDTSSDRLVGWATCRVTKPL